LHQSHCFKEQPTVEELMKVKPFLLGLPLLVIGASCVFAQSEKEKAEKQAEQRQELQTKSLALLDEIAAGAWGLKLPENRSYVLIEVADALWPHNEKRARNMFWEALNSLAPASSQAAGDSTAKPAAKDRAQSQQAYLTLFSLRREILSKVAARDPQLALDMLRATRQLPPEQPNTTFHLPDDRDLENLIAGQAAELDPKRALQMARESLTKGLSFQLLDTLYRLNRRSPETALEFSGDIILKIHSADMSTDRYASFMAGQLLRFARTGDTAESDKPLGLSEDQKRELVEAITDAALAAPAGAHVISVAAEVMPEIEHFAPDRAQRLESKLAEFNRNLTKDQRDWKIYDSLFRDGTPEEMIKAAAKVGSEARESFYQQAVIAAVMKGRGDALREFIKNDIEDESRRNNLLDTLDAEQIGFAVSRGKTDELQKLLAQVRLKEQRAQAMAELAVLLEKKGEHEEAIKLLEGARTLVKVDLNSATHTNALMALIVAYALVDPAKAFAMIEPIVERANADVSRLMLLAKMAKNDAVRNGEIVLQGSGIMPVDFLLFKFGAGVVALAKADFNRTRGAADRFERPELRLMARLLLAQALLRANKPAPTISSQ
jgi:hypothetical protein